MIWLGLSSQIEIYTEKNQSLDEQKPKTNEDRVLPACHVWETSYSTDQYSPL